MEKKTIEKKDVISSLAFKFTERLSVKLIGLVISVVLARLLAPEDFGQVAILTVFINLSQTIIQSGLNVALVQNKDTTDEDFSTVFMINVVLAVVLAAVLYFLAPLIGDFYDSDALALPLRIYSLSLFFGAFNSIQLARMERLMKFKQLMFCGLISTILSGAVGVFFAYKGSGIWALIIYYFSNVVFNCITMLVAQRWLPRLFFSATRAKVLFNYGWKILVSALLCSLYNDIRSLIIGKKYSSADLGYYDRGQQFPYIISTTLDSSIQSVMMPTLSREQDNNEGLKRILRRANKTSALMVIPAMFGLAMVAEPVVKLLLTDKWLPCVPYMQLLCFAFANIPCSSSNLIAIKALGEAGLYMRLEIARRIVMFAILTVSIAFFKDPIAIAVGFVVSSWVDVVIIMFPVKKVIGYSIYDLICDTWKTFASTCIMCIVIFCFRFVSMNYVFKLALQIVIGIAVYCLTCRIIKNEAYYYIRKELQQVLNLKIIKDNTL